MNIFRSSRSIIAISLALGLSTPLALANNSGKGSGDKKVNTNEGLAQGKEERAEKKGVEGREERTLGKGMGREERTEKKGVEGREERAKRHRNHHGRAEARSRNARQR
jgi:hypothetical protein